MIELSIPDHPFYANDSIVPDPALLDALVAGYEAELDGAPPDPITFLADSAPVNTFERIFEQEPRELPAQNFIWMLYVSGYFTGVWLRAQVQRAQLENMSVYQALPPSKRAFDAIVSRAQAGLGALHRADDAVLEHCEAVLPELVEGFGYYQGALLQILAVPPKGMGNQSRRLVVRGPLWCGHASPRLEVLADLYDTSAKLLHSHDAQWNRLLDWIPQAEQAEAERGRTVCRRGFSVQGWSRESYEQFVCLMGVFLEVFQATALTTVRAVAEGDPQSGLRACVAHACLVSWRDAFMLGLNDGRSALDGESILPRFTPPPVETDAGGDGRALQA